MTSTDGRRILLVSYHFGEGCPTGGFRWNATAEHLCSHGWDVDVITVARDSKPQTPAPQGPGSLRSFPVEPVHTPTRIKGALLTLLRRLRSWLEARTQPATESAVRQVDSGDLFVWRAGYQRSIRERLCHALDYVESAWQSLPGREGPSALPGRC
jgi:hypothetical protein